MKTAVLVIAGASAGYFKVDRAGLQWADADKACKAKGMDLVTFENEAEYEKVLEWLGDTTDAYWTGYRDDHGTVEPAGYTRFAEGEPNDKMGDEFCIRLRFGTLNDALCEIYWAGPKKQNIGMGYICENDEEFAIADKEDGAPNDDLIVSGPVMTEQKFPSHIMSNVYRSNKKSDAKLTTGVFERVPDKFEHGRPVYVNKDTKRYLSYSYNPEEQMPTDAKWKFSAEHMVGPSVGGLAYIESQAMSPDQIKPQAPCYFFRVFGPKKNRRFRKMNCIFDVDLKGFDGEKAVGVKFGTGPKSKLSMVNGVYLPVELDNINEAYKKVGADVYAVKRDGEWVFVETRDIHTKRAFARINSSENLVDIDLNSESFMGKKPSDFLTYTF